MRYPAELYVALHSGTPGDAAFYRRVCRDARSVLELGCGNGRILWGLRRPGRSLVGLDRDREMLQLARRHAATDGRSALPSGSAVAGFRGGERGKRLGSAPTWVQADMAAFALGRRFDAIILPFSGFFCLSPAKKRSSLACVGAHLRSGGRFVLDAYAGGALRHFRAGREPRRDDFTWVANVRHAGARYEVFERDTWWPSRQRLDIEYSYRRADGVERVGRLRHWYLFLEQVEALLERAGFTSERQRLSPSVSFDEQWALVATRR